MFKTSKALISAALLGALSVPAFAQTPINGTVQSRCIIQTDRGGVYANPNAYTLTTSPADGGELARIRVDVSLADAYYVEITAPEEFSSAPSLPDYPIFTGDTEVAAVSDATNMGDYETNKTEIGMIDRYELTATGSTWFKTQSMAVMGGNKAFPGGNYTAIVEASCIAK